MKKHIIFIDIGYCLMMSYVCVLIGSAIWIFEHRKIPYALASFEGIILLMILTLVCGVVISIIPWGYYNSEKINAFNTLCMPHTILWKNVIKAKRRNVFGLKYICLYSKGDRFALWIPLNIRNAENFEIAIRENCNENILNSTTVQNSFSHFSLIPT